MNCRSCGATSFAEVLDLGPMPLVNNLLRSPDDPCRRWPLHAVLCLSCALVQLTQSPRPQQMFDEYLYFSSQSQTMVEHARELVQDHVQPQNNVLEIASNDGYLLQHAMTRGARVLGVDPARNIVETANARGIPTRCAYFNTETAQFIAADWGRADVVFMNNVLAHVPDPNQLIAGLVHVLAQDGTAHIEVPYLRRMIDLGAFDTIYHEHYSYFSVTSLRHLVRRHGLHIADVHISPIHGGSLHLQVRRTPGTQRADDLCDAERELGMLGAHYYAHFAQRVSNLRNALRDVLHTFQTVAAFGAAAKGIVLLNAFGLDRQCIPWVADVSPHKQGRYVPGTLQEIVAPSRLLSDRPGAALLLPWNIRDEIVARNSEYLKIGGCFVVPIPNVEIVGS